MTLAAWDAKELQARVDAHYWHHSIDFGNGVISKGTGSSIELISAQGNAMFDGLNLAGKSLLDIGAWNGAFSLEAKRRGAERVVASDKYCWTRPFYRGRETFDLALELTGLQIEAKEIDVPDITPEAIGEFDAVLFAGVFYHLFSPINLTQQISRCARHALILETHQDFLHTSKPGMMMYPGMMLGGDPTNWWGPNPRCIYELLLEFGFVRVFYQDAPGFDNPALASFRKRGIFHAFRSNESLYRMGGKNSKWMDLVDEDVRAELFRPIGKISVPDTELEEALQRISLLEAENGTIKASTSWRITSPMRALAKMLRGA